MSRVPDIRYLGERDWPRPAWPLRDARLNWWRVLGTLIVVASCVVSIGSAWIVFRLAWEGLL